ncbi:MAG: sugar phosphate isomerase/epimerase [Firmicutes bacterium]|nr:sugar phosphate isomerase/epimerase [Bacillota bacterium]
MLLSVSSWIFGDEPLEAVFERASRYGLDGVELVAEPDGYDIDQIQQLCNKHKLKVFSLLGMYPWPTDSRDLSHPDADVRNRAVAYLQACVDLALALGARSVNVIPTGVFRTRPVRAEATEELWTKASQEEWKHAVDSIRRAADYAQQRGVYLAIEPINRYETYLVNNVEQALRFIEDVGSDAVRLQLDTFHMQMEEADPAEAVRKAAARLVNVHLADSNRRAVGDGQFNFRAVLDALRFIGYKGPLTLEPVPPGSDPFLATRLTLHRSLRDRDVDVSVRRLRMMLESV